MAAPAPGASLAGHGTSYSMRRYSLLILVLLASCGPAPEAGLRLVTIENGDTGLSLRELPPQVLRSIGLPYGLAVVKAGVLAERAGLKIGDVVYGVNQKKVQSLDDFNRLLAQQGSSTLGLLVRRGATDFYVAVDLAGAGAPRDLPKGLPSPRETLLRT
jgi:membrane-associated protease RseP (regulator of RpoE activity)